MVFEHKCFCVHLVCATFLVCTTLVNTNMFTFVFCVVLHVLNFFECKCACVHK